MCHGGGPSSPGATAGSRAGIGPFQTSDRVLHPHGYRSSIVRERQPARRMRSVSLPPCASHWWANVCRKPVGVNIRDTGLRRPSAHDIADPAVGHRARVAQPERWGAGGLPAGPGSDVPVQGSRSPASERAESRPATLPDDEREVRLEVDVRDTQARELPEAHAGVDQEAQDGGVPPVGEALAATGAEQPVELGLRKHRRRMFRDVRRPHVAHRGLGDLALFDGPREEDFECTVAVGHGGGHVARVEAGEERLDVLPPDVRPILRHPLGREEGAEQPVRFVGGRDGARRLVLRSEGAPVALDQRQIAREGGGRIGSDSRRDGIHGRLQAGARIIVSSRSVVRADERLLPVICCSPSGRSFMERETGVEPATLCLGSMISGRCCDRVGAGWPAAPPVYWGLFGRIPGRGQDRRSGMPASI